jgi:hypothetical protein
VQCRARFGLRPEEEEGADVWGRLSAAAGRKKAYPFGVRVILGRGQKGVWAGKLPRSLFNFSSFSFSFLFYFCFEICLVLVKTSDLNLSHTLEFVKLFFWYLKHTGKVFDLRAKQNLKKSANAKRMLCMI